MFRLIKLAMYGLLGWVLYELYQGMVRQTESAEGTGRASSRSLRRALDEDAGRMSPTNTGGGALVSTADDDGGTMTHTVGRGVVNR